MLWSLLGYCDALLNCNIPGITGAGSRGHELGAIAVFARALGAYAVATGVEGGQITLTGALDDAPYTVIGVLPSTYRHLGLRAELVVPFALDAAGDAARGITDQGAGPQLRQSLRSQIRR